nr:major histocompatibility complex class I [Ogcocephalus cubifrons]
MKPLVCGLLLGIGLHAAGAVLHSLKYFEIMSSGVPNFPEFVAVGYVDEVLVDHYDSNTRRSEPKQDWMKKVTADDPQYWDRETEINIGNHQRRKVDVETLKQRINQTGGFHIIQKMYGCEWDDETGQVTGFLQFGYNGEDFIVLDLKTETWIAPNPQAVITKHKFDHDRVLMEYNKYYYTQLCPEWGKKYVDYGKSSLLRTELPSVFLLQKTPSSPVSCHATGFYPNRAALSWRRDGEELHEEVEHGEILPNPDGTFQMSVDLDLSSAPPEDWRRYDCVFQLYGVEDDLVTRLDKDEIWTNWEEPVNVTAIIITIAAVALALLLIAAVGFMVHRRRSADCPPCPDDSSDLSERLKPEAETTNTPP